ncbi:syntaxin-1A-like [Colias croceus]|uniref:syntaxin-1A-like n=1 Tax=Colias crocea TaxID=72248 RepID=UPI001E27C953|nr:syntaxin-1A-like [Colias croceus]
MQNNDKMFTLAISSLAPVPRNAMTARTAPRGAAGCAGLSAVSRRAYQCAIRYRRERPTHLPPAACRLLPPHVSADMTCKDRLPELRRRAKAAGVCAELAPPSPGPPAVPEPAAGPDPLLAEIFAEVEQIRTWIGEVADNTRRVRRLHADPTYHTNKALQEQVDALVTASNAAGLKLSGALRQLAARCEAAGGAGGARGRIARLQAAAARRHYADALADHQHALQLLRDHQMRLLQDQIRLTNLSISDEECERLLDSNNIALFVDNVEAETADARLALRDAEARREELARVEAALRHVRDLFLQLAHLVAAQQDQLDSVEYFALQATEHVECGGQQLLKGTVSRRKARKKKIGLIICITSGFLIVLFVLVYT